MDGLGEDAVPHDAEISMRITCHPTFIFGLYASSHVAPKFAEDLPVRMDVETRPPAPPSIPELTSTQVDVNCIHLSLSKQKRKETEDFLHLKFPLPLHQFSLPGDLDSTVQEE